MCVEVNSTDERQTLFRDVDGQLFNASKAHTLEVVCPIVGPFNDLSPNADGDEVSQVFVVDRNGSENICCESRANNVGVIYRSPEVCSKGKPQMALPISMLEMTNPSVLVHNGSAHFRPMDHAFTNRQEGPCERTAL